MAASTDAMVPKYIVTVRDREFRLSKRQIEFDSPNFFTACFLGSFQESASKSVALDRDPHIFAVIVEYLSGYEILPLPAGVVPGMDLAYVTRNLLVDADFYGLTGLKRLLSVPSLPPSLGLEWAGLARKVVTLSEVISEHLPPGVEYVDGGLYSEEDGNQLPVLVSARDVPIRLSASRELDLQFGTGRASAKPNTEKVTFKIDYMESRDGRMATAIKHPPSIVADSVFQAGKMRINEWNLSLADFSGWWKNDSLNTGWTDWQYGFFHFYPCSVEPSSPPYRRYEGVLWADEILFTVVGRSSDAGDPVLHIKIADLKARSRGVVLSELSHPGSRWERQTF